MSEYLVISSSNQHSFYQTILTLEAVCRMNLEARRSCNGLKDVGDLGGASCSTINPEQYSGGSLWQPVNFEDDMCRLDDNDDLAFGASTKFNQTLLSSDCNQVKK